MIPLAHMLRKIPLPSVIVRRLGLALVIPVLITLLARLSELPLAIENVASFYLFGVVVVAVASGVFPAVIASLISFLAYNFFFIEPRHTFDVRNPQDIIRLAMFLGIAVITSSIAAYGRSQADEARRRAAETAGLYELSQAIALQLDIDDAMRAVATTVCRLLDTPGCIVLLADQSGRFIEHVRVGQVPAGHGIVTVAMSNESHVVGALQVVERSPGSRLDARQRRVLDALAAQARLAVERVRLAEAAARTRALAESDQLKSALIASVSHDLRTPLAAIKGAASTLSADDVQLDAAARRDLALTIEDEADRLNRVVGNLLDMSRIEAGALPLQRDWQDLAEMIGAVMRRHAALLRQQHVTLDLAADLPLVLIHAGLIEQVFVNLLDNAGKYTPPDAYIVIRAWYDRGADAVVVSLRDNGPGIIAGELDHIFEKFYRGAVRAGVSGSGLGLAICRGIVEAHGGQIWAESPAGGGAVFLFTLPAGKPPQPESLSGS